VDRRQGVQTRDPLNDGRTERTMKWKFILK